MGITRRSLLQDIGAGCALALLAPVAGAATTLRRYEVRDTIAAPRFASGDVVLADSASATFGGKGLYLYPAWGEPRLYEVDAVAGRLEFRNPGSGRLLWTQSAGIDAAFAGKVLTAEQSSALVAACPALAVPVLPS